VEVVRRIDPDDLEHPFAKEPSDEEFLERLNLTLAPRAEAEYLELDEVYPTLHVIGVPRSGTTLLYQVVASGLEIGFVDNLVAAFWLAPVYGLRLSKKLGLGRQTSSFESTFGRTPGIGEPHEFGYFWNHHLRYPDLCEQPTGHEGSIDWARLRKVLVNLAHVAGGPMAYKPMLLTWHLETMLEHVPRTCYVWIRRDLCDTALSLLRMRRSLRGSDRAWVSLRPVGPSWLENEPPWRQVAAQAVVIERVIEAAAARMGPEHVLELRYETLCARPSAVVGQIRDFLGSKGHAPALRPADLGSFQPRGDGELAAEYGPQVREAIREYSALPAPTGAGG
jgi:hypothetical protein